MNPRQFTRPPPPGFVGAMPVRRPAPAPPSLIPPRQLPAAGAAGPVYGGGSFLAYLLSDLPAYTTRPVPVTASSFIDEFMRGSQQGEEELKVQRLAHLVADKWMHSYESLVYPLPVVAASAIFLARLVLPGFRPWSPELRELTGFTDNDLDECLHAMNRFCEPRSLLLAM